MKKVLLFLGGIALGLMVRNKIEYGEKKPKEETKKEKPKPE